MKLVVFNSYDTQREVPVENADGTKTTIFIQPKSKVKLAPGQSVQSLFLRQHAKKISTLDLDV
jgi:hypothetical protein